MIVLHHCVSARSFRPLWMMEEMGLDFDLRMLPFPPRERQRDYLAINPLGTVPGFSDRDTFMTESAAICQFLVARYGPTPLDVDCTNPAYGSFLNWVHFGEATLTFPQTIILRYGRFEPPDRRLPQAVLDYTKWFLARLRAVDAVVSRQDHLCAGRFTIADISVGYALMLAADLGLADRFPLAVSAYWLRLKSRRAFVEALHRQTTEAIEQGVSPNAAAMSDKANEAPGNFR